MIKLFHRRRKRAIGFVDYEYWYIALKQQFGVQPDIRRWADQLRETYDLNGLYFFANFTQDYLKSEVARIREVSNRIIETQCSYNGSYIKDMSDFIILDCIYRKSVGKKMPQHVILFTGDGHFQPVVRFLVQDKRKNVIVYGIKNSMSRLLKEAATECRELPDDEETRQLCYQFIVEDYNRIAERHKDVVVTYHSMVSRISENHHVPRQTVEIALSEMLEKGLVTKRKHRAAFGENNINVIVPEWDKLIEAGLYVPEQ